jgi:DNA-binding MarR family transcriptional regulator
MQMHVKSKIMMQLQLSVTSAVMDKLESEADIPGLWARFMRVSQAVLGAVEADLKAAGFPPLGWYDALLELRRVEPEGMRQFELQGHMLLAQYNMSRLVDRLAEARFVRRDACPEDKRGQVVSLTEKGRALIDAMWPVYRAAIEANFGGKLGADDAKALAGILERLRPGGQGMGHRN